MEKKESESPLNEVLLLYAMIVPRIIKDQVFLA